MREKTLERLTHMEELNEPATDADTLDARRRRGPSVGTDSDRDLVEAVSQALGSTGYPALRDIHVELEQGIVVLWGYVATYHQKQLAQVTAQRVDGIRGIANGIEVMCCR